MREIVLQQRSPLQSDDEPIVNVYNTADLFGGGKKGASAAASSAGKNIAGLDIEAPSSAEAPESSTTVGDILKKKKIIPEGGINIPGLPARNETLSITLPAQSLGVSANGSACQALVPTSYTGFPGVSPPPPPHLCSNARMLSLR